MISTSIKSYYQNDSGIIYNGDSLEVLKKLPSEMVQTVITSPPYWGLRDYQVDGQIGLEETISEYISKMVDVFNEVFRVLRKDGTLWLNMGDSYAGSGGAHSKNHKNPGISNSYKRAGVSHYGKLGNPARYLPPNGLKKKTYVVSRGVLPLLCKPKVGI